MLRAGFWGARGARPISVEIAQAGPSPDGFLVPKDGDNCRDSARERPNSSTSTFVSHALSL